MARYSKTEIEESRTTLRKLCPPGTIIYTNLDHVSRSGMMRHIRAHVIRKGEVISIGWYLARVLGYPLTNNNALKVGGAGMDMGFHLAHCLSYAIHGRTAKGADACAADAAGRPFTPRRGHYRPGYSLRHQWL